jgi:hypothetical protein
VCGLATIAERIAPQNACERQALEWLQAWVDAGAMMIGR